MRERGTGMASEGLDPGYLWLAVIVGIMISGIVRATSGQSY